MFALVFCLVATGWATDLEGLASDILEEIWRFHPVTATHLGIHEYDNQMPDYSQKSLDLRLSRFRQLRDELIQIDTVALQVDELVDYYLLRAFLDDEIYDLEKRSVYVQNPLLYVQTCINCVYTLMIRYATTPQARMQAVIARLKKVPAFLEVARQNIKHPSSVLCDVGISQLNEGEKFIEMIFEVYRDSLPEDTKADFQKTKVVAVAAMMRFAYWLEKNQKPGAKYLLGEEGYNYKLKNIYFLNINADSVLKIGQHFLEQTAAMIDSLDELLPPAARQMVALPQDFGKEQVNEYRREEVDNLRNFVEEVNIVTVPDWIGNIEIVETPRFLQELIPGVAMMPPGPFDKSRTSYFFTPALPVKFDVAETEYYYNYIHNRWFRGAAVHEAYPGHHLQLSIANQHTSEVRKCFRDNFFIEGWALYCEELMARSGLYDDSIGALINALEGVQYRAARIIVDVKLQTGEFDYDDALQFMVETFGGGEAYYAREIKRYISNPIQPSSYLIGKIQLLGLLDDYRRLRGNDFNLKDFHDNLLSHGSIPIELVRRLVLEGLY